MSEGSLMMTKAQGLYKKLCKDNWSANTTGIIVAIFSILMLAWDRPWGAVGAVRNWGEWMLYSVGMWADQPASVFAHSGSIIGIGFVAGAFLSACLGGDFAFRIPPPLEMVKAVVAGLIMGVGASLAGGCNVGGFYNAIGMLSAHGFAMMGGLVIGAILGLKYTFWEMSNVSWGTTGGKTIELPNALKTVLGVVALAGIIWGARNYANSEDLTKFGGTLVLAAALGYVFQRGRWCMIQGFREPHMTGDCELAKSVALSVAIVAVGAAVIKGVGLREVDHYVRGTFGLGGVLGGIIFGFGAILAGGCGTGTLWRVGEGQIKLWIVTPFFGISSAIFGKIVKSNSWEAERDAGTWLGKFVYMPDSLGYTVTIALILIAMAVWYVIVDWNEDTNKFTLEM